MNERERFRRADEIFRAARRLEVSRRESFVLDRAGNDEPLRRDVLALLEEDARDRGPLDAPPVGVVDLSSLTRSIETPLPAAIGRYRIIRRLGVGGMGAVYEAEQETPRRRVALKVVRSGLVTRDILARFQREAQALGSLSHPGIARIYEAGTASIGGIEQPYFAMELIEGKPLLEHANTERLDIRARLDLIARIADALHHAHERAIIHRDLKPANILVDARGEPRILDFGVARIASDSDALATLATAPGALVGTLAYMSPEQARGDSRIDPRTDVYSLGVVTFELLAGELPYSVSAGALHEAAKRIQDSDPRALSTINRAFRGDIETMIAKAIEKSPSRRYASAADFAADIRRYLASKPIIARPASAMYSLGKFASRHRQFAAAIAIAFIALAAAVVVVTVFALRESRARADAEAQSRRAQQKAEIASAIADFLNEDLLASARPTVAQGRDLTVRDALDLAEASIGERFADKPLTEAGIRESLGRARLELADLKSAERHLARALVLSATHLGPEAPETLRSAESLAETYWRQGCYSESIALRRNALAIAERTLGPDHEQTISILIGLGDTIQHTGVFDEAAMLLSIARERVDRSHGPNHLDAIVSRHNLAAALVGLGELGEAVTLQVDAAERALRLCGELHPLTSDTRHNVARWRLLEGAYGEALEEIQTAVEIRARIYGLDANQTMISRVVRARILDALGRHAEAEPEYRAALGVHEAVFGPRHRQTLITRMYLAGCLLQQARVEEALDAVAPARRVIDEVHPNDAGRRGLARAYYGACLARLGRRDDAVAELRDARRLLEQSHTEPPDLHAMVDALLAQ